jgi:Cu-Zn family superoxide dismutase
MKQVTSNQSHWNENGFNGRARRGSHAPSVALRVTAGLLCAATALGCAAADDTKEDNESEAAETGNVEQASHIVRSATLRNANGAVVGRVIFVAASATATSAAVSLTLSPAQEGFHGIHVHANDNPANGDGCIADPAQPANTHFVSADAHFNGGTHGDHRGDIPPVLVMADGRATMASVTDRFAVADLVGRAVILHQNADNLGNIPVGSEPAQYTPNSPAATTLTANTGNAGNRIACGVIQ